MICCADCRCVNTRLYCGPDDKFRCRECYMAEFLARATPITAPAIVHGGPNYVAK